METDARKRARAAYRERNSCKRIVLELPQALRDSIVSRAAALGLPVTAYLVGLFRQDAAAAAAADLPAAAAAADLRQDAAAADLRQDAAAADL